MAENLSRYEATLAPYASTAATTRGRLYDEPASKTRTPYQRDRDRIIHCSAFRRMKHKTQVFVYHEGDYYRTRLTHSIEVAQIARSICRALALNEDLAEALALAHDFGHTAFGHAGEDTLDECMAPFNGFDHNAQTLRLVTKLEKRYARFPGLNLTWEALEGLAKHNGPLAGAPVDPANPPEGLPAAFAEYLAIQDLEVHTHASLEAQVAAIADDIAYNNHDIDDGLRAGLFTLDDLCAVPFIAETVDSIRKREGKTIDPDIMVHELVRALIDRTVRNILAQAEAAIADLAPGHPDDVRHAGRTLIAFSETLAAEDKLLKQFLKQHMYAHPEVTTKRDVGQKIVRELFGYFMNNPTEMPAEWNRGIDTEDEAKKARVIADYIAGMTDRYAVREYERIFGGEVYEGAF